MAINPFRKSTIRKIDAKFFKDKKQEREDLARSVGDRGLSKGKMDDRLRAEGYDPKKRGNIIGQVSGAKKKEGLTDEQKRKNILSLRRGDLRAKTGYASGRVAFGNRGVETRSRIGLGGAPAPSGNANRFVGGSAPLPGASPASPINPVGPAINPGAGLGPKRFL